MPVLVLSLLYAAALAWAVSRHAIAPWLPWVLVAINLGTFLAYALDKHAARRGRRRIRERTLHLWSLAGGWPAAGMVQRVLRHKTAKASFQRGYWLAVLGHGLAVAGWWYLRRLLASS